MEIVTRCRFRSTVLYTAVLREGAYLTDSWYFKNEEVEKYTSNNQGV
jgi:hypothetical protein